MSTETQRDEEPTTEQIKEATFEVWRSHGYLVANKDGVLTEDKGKVREIIADFLCEAQVVTKGEVAEKAKTRGEIFPRAFPQFPALEDREPGSIEDSVYTKLSTFLWTELATDHRGPMQTTIGDTYPGYLLCRTKVARDGNPIDAVYITTTLSLIQRDFVSPLNVKLNKLAKRMADDVAMAISRQPGHRKALMAQADMGLKVASQTVSSTLLLTEGEGK